MIWWEPKRQSTSWVWGLYPVDSEQTRLISRVRMDYRRGLSNFIFGLLLIEPADFPMMRKCMLGIKRRAEQMADRTGVENPSSVFVALETIGYGFFGLVMLASGAVFAGGRLERWIRGLFFASGVTGILGAVAAPLGQEMLTLIGFGLSLLAFLAATVLVGVFFKRLTRRLPTPT